MTCGEFRLGDKTNDVRSLPVTLRSDETRRAFRLFFTEWNFLKAINQKSQTNRPLRTPLGKHLRDLESGARNEAHTGCDVLNVMPRLDGF